MLKFAKFLRIFGVNLIIYRVYRVFEILMKFLGNLSTFSSFNFLFFPFSKWKVFFQRWKKMWFLKSNKMYRVNVKSSWVRRWSETINSDPTMIYWFVVHVSVLSHSIFFVLRRIFFKLPSNVLRNAAKISFL